ncbi:hypothetical protein RHIZ404_230552 [Rhizobium sp. EC-SD404]|nr:hypothetical protein RHIZ404_230552 [Rhizobium sp. EC-SD404]
MMAEHARCRLEQDEAGQPLGLLLGRLANEMSDLAGAVEALETDLIAGGGAETNDARLMRLQTLDLTIQRLRGLGHFLDALSLNVPHGVGIDLQDALRIMTLSDVKDRLSGAADARSAAMPESGGIELF